MPGLPWNLDGSPWPNSCILHANRINILYEQHKSLLPEGAVISLLGPWVQWLLSACVEGTGEPISWNSLLKKVYILVLFSLQRFPHSIFLLVPVQNIWFVFNDANLYSNHNSFGLNFTHGSSWDKNLPKFSALPFVPDSHDNLKAANSTHALAWMLECLKFSPTD